MDCILLKVNEYFFVTQWVLVAAGILIAYLVVNVIVKIFSNLNEEMWTE